MTSLSKYARLVLAVSLFTLIGAPMAFADPDEPIAYIGHDR